MAVVLPPALTLNQPSQEYCDGEMSEDLTGDGAYVVWKGLFPHLLKVCSSVLCGFHSFSSPCSESCDSPLLVQSLYDHDVCEEEAILKWAGHLERSESPSQRQYHQQVPSHSSLYPFFNLFCALSRWTVPVTWARLWECWCTQCLPFIEWLKTAEEEDEDEDSSAEESEND
mgnify:FL=1